MLQNSLQCSGVLGWFSWSGNCFQKAEVLKPTAVIICRKITHHFRKVPNNIISGSKVPGVLQSVEKGKKGLAGKQNVVSLTNENIPKELGNLSSKLHHVSSTPPRPSGSPNYPPTHSSLSHTHISYPWRLFIRSHQKFCRFKTNV